MQRHRGTHVFDRLITKDLVGYGYQTDGDKIYVDATYGLDTKDGHSWAYAKKTITAALAAAGAKDHIVVGTGLYLEGATLIITQAQLKLIGVMSSGHQWGQPSIHTHGTETLVKVDAADPGQVEIANLAFHDQGAGISLEIAHSVNVWRTHVHDCFFGGNSTALWAVVIGNTGGSGVGDAHTVDAPLSIVEDCQFYMFVTGNIFQNAASVVRRNLIAVGASAHGIRYFTNSTSRPYGYILDNKIHTIDPSAAVGISVTNTPDPGYLFIDGNHLAGFADAPHAIDLSGGAKTGLMGLNYHGITAIPIP
jgi:hypothetical protein